MNKAVVVVFTNTTLRYESVDPVINGFATLEDALKFVQEDADSRNIKQISSYKHNDCYITSFEASSGFTYQYLIKELELKTYKRVEWLFNFKGGGWNSEYAVTKEEAYRLACERMPDLENEILADSFRVSTHEEKEFLLRSFY